jgi:hypothetical protein
VVAARLRLADRDPLQGSSMGQPASSDASHGAVADLDVDGGLSVIPCRGLVPLEAIARSKKLRAAIMSRVGDRRTPK